MLGGANVHVRLIQDSLSPPHSLPETASRSTLPFFPKIHGRYQRTDRQTDRPTERQNKYLRRGLTTYDHQQLFARKQSTRSSSVTAGAIYVG